MDPDRPRIALLVASFDKTHTPRNFRRELAADLEEFDATEGHLPPDYDYDAVAVTGSRASVYWDEEWIDESRRYVQEAVDADLPVLGVCWGHQLLADALGGTVDDMGEYELGYREVSLTDAGRDHPVLVDVPDPFVAFTTHSDEVIELPPEATLLAENDCSIQAFAVDDAVGVQFHPEYDTETARSVTEKKDLPDERIERVLDGITEEAYHEAVRTKALFDGFVDIVRRRTVSSAD